MELSCPDEDSGFGGGLGQSRVCVFCAFLRSVILAKMGNLELGPGSLFANRFEVERAAGSGGMGTVYRATDRYSGAQVALKLLHAGTGGHGEQERFAREAQLLSELHHPGIVAYVAHGQIPDGRRFLAMEWLEGMDLGQRLTRGPLPVRDCVRLAEQIAAALGAAHQRGFIHRDLKPTNLFLVGGDVNRVKILDFGIARRIDSSQALTRTGMVIGTPEYMAPEQARGARELTPAADLFSLGCVLYECLTGQPPFVADHVAAVLVRILLEEPTPVEERRPGVPAGLAAVLGRLLAKQPTQRIGDAAALQAELLSLGELPEPALAVTLASPSAKVQSFVEHDQSLISVVLAAPKDEDIGLDATQVGPSEPLGASQRQALFSALADLGGSAEFLANGTLVVTILPMDSAQDQVMLAARMALCIKAAWPESVVSVSTGHGSIRGQTAVGAAVDQAARGLRSGGQASDRAAHSAVFVDALSAKLLAGRFVLKPEANGAWLVGEEKEVDASRPLLGKPTPCVGRDVELATMESSLSACVAEEEFRGLVITGAPGSGKSRLRHEFLRRVEQRFSDVQILLGRGELLSAGTGYRILASALRRHFGFTHELSEAAVHARIREIAETTSAHEGDEESRVSPVFLGELLGVPFPEEESEALRTARRDPSLMHFQLRRTFVSWLRQTCRRAPVLFVLDDLHWGDALTVALFESAMQEIKHQPFCVLALARPEVHTLFPKLWHGHAIHEIALKGLGKKACERLIQHALGSNIGSHVIAQIVAQSAGNALFLEELIRMVAAGSTETLPDTVLAMLQARIGRLPIELRRSLRAASIFGHTFSAAGLAALLDTQPDDPLLTQSIATLRESEMIERHSENQHSGKSEYGFRHILVREAAYALLTEPDRRGLHRAAGLFLAEQPSPEPRVVAEHLLRGQEAARAVHWLMRAAQQALDGNDLSAVGQYVEKAVACGAEGEVLGQLRALEMQAAYWSSDYPKCISLGEEAGALLPTGSSRWYQVLTSAAVACGRTHQFATWKQLVSKLLAAKPERGATEDQALSFLRCSNLFSGLADHSALETLLQRATELIAQEQISAPLVLAQYHDTTATRLNFFADVAAFLHHAESALAFYEKAGDTRNMLILRGTVSAYWTLLGRIDVAESLVRKNIVASDRAGFASGAWISKNLLARMLVIAQRKLPEARALLAEAVVRYAAIKHLAWQVQITLDLALLDEIESKLLSAETALCELMALQEKNDYLSSRIGIPMAALARIRLKLGRGEEALSLARRAAGLVAEGGPPLFIGWHHLPRLVLLECLVACGPEDEAKAAVAAALSWLHGWVARIPNEAWRTEYLNIPDYVRIPQLARQLRLT